MRITIDSAGTTYIDTIAPKETAAASSAEKTAANAVEESAETSGVSSEASAEKTVLAQTFQYALDTAASQLVSDAAAEDSSDVSASRPLDDIFTEASATYGVDKQLLLAVAKTESSFQPNAVSASGAVGVMQLMPKTAASLGVTDAYDAYQNIMGGAKYLSQLLSRYNGDVSLALAAYNAGSRNVAKAGGVPSYAQSYVNKVLGYYADASLAAPDASYSSTVSKEDQAKQLQSMLSTFSDHESYELFLKEASNEIADLSRDSSDADAMRRLSYEDLLSASGRAISKVLSDIS